MTIRHGFYHDPSLARPFFELQRLVFPSLDLAWAHERGYLRANTVPFGLFKDGRAISILNATTMEISTGSTLTTAVQLGTVATHPDHRGCGHSAALMRHVLDHYAGVPLFLFANDSVLEFYPRFGFSPRQEYSFSIELRGTGDRCFRQLDPAQPDHARIIAERFASRAPLSLEYGIADYANLAEWYCIAFYRDCLWYDDTRQTLLVAMVEESQLVVHDVVSPSLDRELFTRLRWPGVDRVTCHFVPDRFAGELVPETVETMHFVRGDLPVHPTPKIPTLAHT